MQLGFVIDHTRCIGCHACTVACKSENEVPLGTFRTWVKYTESGEFPSVRRDFSVLRCNQCSDAPCVSICPTAALGKGDNGIVDVDPALCIGCKSCMHGCPYDALYINPHSGTAEKCHFCAHRTEVGLAPACAVVCPTEAIIPGDFDDPESRVSQMKQEFPLQARKPEAGTGPNVLYREVADAGIDPGLTNASKGFIWSSPPTGESLAAEEFRAGDTAAALGMDPAAVADAATARTVYDVPRQRLWGSKITAYLWAKSVAAGAMPVALLAAFIGGGRGDRAGLDLGLPALLSLIGLALTGLFLVADLKRPERFLYILLKPNWSSWLVRGSYIILVYGLLLSVGLAFAWAGVAAEGLFAGLLAVAIVLFGAATAAYTGFLFAQAKGRVLWMRRLLWLHLIVQAGVAGAATLLLADAFGADFDPAVVARVGGILLASLALHLLLTLAEGRLSPPGREAEFHRTARLISHGPYARTHWGIGVGLGIVVPMLCLTGIAPPAVAGALALIGLWIEEDLLVRAGQALPIS